MTKTLCHHCGNWTESEKPKKGDPRVRTVMDTLEGERGYPSGNHGAEAAAVKKMLKHYSESDILECYRHLKKAHFWSDKALFMMTVASQIGAWKKYSVKESANYEDAVVTAEAMKEGKASLIVDKLERKFSVDEQDIKFLATWKAGHPNWTPENRRE